MNQKNYKAIFFGTPDIAIPTLKSLIKLPFISLEAVFTQPDKPVGKKQIITPPIIKTEAEKNNIPVYQPEKINQAEENIRKIDPDIIIVLAYGKIIPEKLLDIPKYGWLNIHASILPKFRGASPIQAVILIGAKQTGVTLMEMDSGLDTGNIISQKKIDLDSVETSETLHDKLSKLSAEIIKSDLQSYLEGHLKSQPQDNGQSTETKIISKEDGQIDWTNSAEQIERQFRAYSPWPGTYTTWNGKRLIIHQLVIADQHIALLPGRIKRLGSTILIGTGSSVLEIKNLQLEGKQIQETSEFLKGYPDFDKAILK